jgi:hypothetical protein
VKLQTISSLFSFFVGHFCPPGSGSTADQTESGSGSETLYYPPPTKNRLDAIVIVLLVISLFLSFFFCASKRGEFIFVSQGMYSHWCRQTMAGKESRFFLLFLLDDRRTRIRIQKAQKHTDPSTDPDPQHCSQAFTRFVYKGMLPALSKPAAGGGGGKSVEEALNLLGQGFLRGGLGSSFLKSAAGGSAAPSPELRVGVSQAYVAAFAWLGPAWTERHLHAALTHVLDLAGGSSRSAASHTELVYTREVFVWIRWGVGGGGACSEGLTQEVHKEMSSILDNQ